MRHCILALVALVLADSALPAQGWAEKMFPEGLTHDFGNVPRGAQLYHKFKITNLYAVRMEITSISASCGCVTASSAQRVLEPRQSTWLEVNMDGRRFTGFKTVTVRVTVGPEFISSAELRVSAQSRADIVFNPGEVNFGVVNRGQPAAQTIDVEYAGPLNWQVSEVIARDVPVEVGLKELYRRPGQVGYQVQVTLKPDVPPGALKREIYLKTNDPTSPLVPILLEARVAALIEVTPNVLNLGPVKVGETFIRRVSLKGDRPFRILGIDGLGEGVALGAELASSPGPVHTVTFRCQPLQPGEFRRELKIRTDLQDTPVAVLLQGSATP